jgi:hypothetical protein
MTTLPHEFKRIRLEMARSKEFPEGSATHGYEFVAPLDAAGHVNPTLWQKHREHCRVVRFWGDEEETGQLVHRPGGAEHARWLFHYANGAEPSDESGYRFGVHPFRPGEYVSVRDEKHEVHTFRVVSVNPASE